MKPNSTPKPTLEALAKLLTAFGTTIQALSAKTGITPGRLRGIYLFGNPSQLEAQAVIIAFGQIAASKLLGTQNGVVNQAGTDNIQFVENLNVFIGLSPSEDPFAPDGETRALRYAPQHLELHQGLPGGQVHQLGQLMQPGGQVRQIGQPVQAGGVVRQLEPVGVMLEVGRAA